MPAPLIQLRLDSPVTSVQTTPGGEIILRGAFHSVHDGSVIDAATTTWPKENPVGAGIDSGGIVDLQAGGFHITSRDATTHEVHAVATGQDAPACAALGVTSPCLPLRLRDPAWKRQLTQDEWVRSLKGGISVEVISPPMYAPAVTASKQYMPFFAIGAVILTLITGIAIVRNLQKKHANSPRGQLLALGKRVQEKAKRADPIFAAPLTSALAGALQQLTQGKVDPTSPEGKRVRVMLEKVEQRLEDEAAKAKSQREQEVADDLAREVEIAFQAAEEALQAGRD